jgi:hypothetical protein
MDAICGEGVAKGSSPPVFTVEDIEKITSFFSLTFAQNVRAFQYVCSELQEQVVSRRLLPMQTPLTSLPLSQATSITEHKTNEDLPAEAISE